MIRLVGCRLHLLLHFCVICFRYRWFDIWFSYKYLFLLSNFKVFSFLQSKHEIHMNATCFNSKPSMSVAAQTVPNKKNGMTGNIPWNVLNLRTRNIMYQSHVSYRQPHLSFRLVAEINYGCDMMTSSNGNISRVTGLLCGELQRLGAFMFFFYLRLNKRLSKQLWGWWFETPLRPLWRHCHEITLS